MLKVIGASDFQTLTSILILVGILVFGILIVILCDYINREDDQKFSATITWNPYTDNFDINLWGQNNDPQKISEGVARAYFQSNMHKTGWAILEIESNDQYADRLQAYAAGILEGILTWKYIYWQWKNTVELTCQGREKFCSIIRDYLKNNTAVIRNTAAENCRTDPFWHQVHLFYRQLDGIEYGFKYEVIRNQENYEIPSLDFLWMNIMSDLRDFEKVFESHSREYSSPAAMSFLKLISNNGGKFLLAHASSGFYTSMLRIQKKYHLKYHIVARSSNSVPGHTIVFTSYPASIHSQDDFYQILIDEENIITVTGTSFDNDITNNELKQPSNEPIVLLGPRVMAANRLSKNGKSWTNTFSLYNSGTGNKQWWYLQSKRSNIYFWVLEQPPRMIISKNETKNLLKQGYWISCNSPYYRVHQPPHRKNYTEVEICKILVNGEKNVTDIESLLKLMREPEVALAGRTDLLLNPASSFQWNYSKKVQNNKSINIAFNETSVGLFNLKNVTSLEARFENLHTQVNKSFPSSNSTTYFTSPIVCGIIDLKLTQNNGKFLAAAGPPFNLDNKEKSIEPFQWSTSKINYLPHNGHSDVWDFQPFAADFVWN